MNTFKKLIKLLEVSQATRTLSGASRAYKKAFTTSWKEGERGGLLQQKANQLEKGGGAAAGIHAETMRKVAKRARKTSSANLDTAMRLRPLVPQSRKRRFMRER